MPLPNKKTKSHLVDVFFFGKIKKLQQLFNSSNEEIIRQCNSKNLCGLGGIFLCFIGPAL
jgi:hypothetical protein